MIRRSLIVVLGFCAMYGVRGAMAQESAARGEGAPAAPATAPRYNDWQDSGSGGAVAAGGRDAVAAGIEILKRGGNAADAAAATILALSVTDSRSFCFGGEVPILVYDARTKGVTVIAGQGVAPRLATREEFVRRGGIPLKGIDGRGGSRGARRLPDPARPLRHDDASPRSSGRRGRSSPARRAASPGTPTSPGRSRRSSPPRPWPIPADRRIGPRSIAGAPARRRRVLSRADRPSHRRLVAGQRRAHPLCRPGDPHDSDRGTGLGHLSRPHRLQVRAVDPGALPAPGAANPRGLRPQGRWDATGPRRSTPSSRR